MKPATRAPVFACLYPGLCDIARKHGYALAIHGTVSTDLDLVAIPWIADAVSAETIKSALMEHISACGYGDLLRQTITDEKLVQQILDRKEPGTEEGGTIKPHGRLAWNLYLQCGSKVDLSVMPRFDDFARAQPPAPKPDPRS